MKKQIVLSLLMMSLSAAAFARPPVSAPNPFEEGTGRELLSENERATLMEYANSSKTRLERALSAAEGLLPEAKLAIYLAAVRETVLTSYQLQGRSELLMRISLNQALDLTYGVPTADGARPARPGILAHFGNVELMRTVLEDSIRMALRYYDEDCRAIEERDLLRLPYNRYAAERIRLLKDHWRAAAFDGEEYDLVIASLYQFMSVANSPQNLDKAFVAQEILDVDGLLKTHPPLGQGHPSLTRPLRKFVNELEGHLFKKKL